MQNNKNKIGDVMENIEEFNRKKDILIRNRESALQRVEKAIDKNNTSIIKYFKTDNVLNDICTIIDSAKDYAFQSVNLALVERNWLI